MNNDVWGRGCQRGKHTLVIIIGGGVKEASTSTMTFEVVSKRQAQPH